MQMSVSCHPAPHPPQVASVLVLGSRVLAWPCVAIGDGVDGVVEVHGRRARHTQLLAQSATLSGDDIAPESPAPTLVSMDA